MNCTPLPMTITQKINVSSFFMFVLAENIPSRPHPRLLLVWTVPVL